MIRILAALLAVLALAGPARARDLDVFVFGNSLVHHLTESDETTVPHWLAQMARADGHALRLDGTWGFLPDFAANLPPEPGWSFAEVERAWDPDAAAFRMAGFDAVVLTPPNFIQGEPPDADVIGGSAVALGARVLDWSANQAPDARLLVYEGWADMGDYGYPPSDRALRRWHAWNREGSHEWHLAYVARLAEETGREVELIPVGSTLSTLLAEGPLAGIRATDLYSDDAPHGTATTYLLAAMVTYAVLTGEAPPLLDLPETIHPVLRENQANVVDAVADAAGVPRQEAAAPDPSLGLGLSGIADWSTEQPFLDIMKTARPWIGQEPGSWGAWDAARLAGAGHLSPEGWPLSLPEGVDRLETFVLTDQPEAAVSLAGTYLLRWEGRGEVSVGGRARDARRDGSSLRFTYASGDGPVSIVVTGVDAADPLRAMTLVREDRAALLEGGALFNPDFLARVRGVRALRFMDWMATNGSPQIVWEDRPRLTDATWAARGVPVEVMVQLANEVGADPWFTLPHGADDAHVAAFAAYVHDHLDPRARVHAEWSNEVWNFIFPQAIWAREQAALRWGEDAPDDAWMQFAGLRAAEVADIWADAFADDPARLIRVVAVHTGWPGLEDPLLDAPLAVAEGRAPPSESFDAYAVTGYFGHDVGAEANAEDLRAWIADGTAAAEVTAQARAGIEELTEDLWPHHARAAAARGLRLVAYEAGTHAVGQGAVTEDEAVTAFLNAWSYSPEMAGLYGELLAGWDAAGGTLLMAFVGVAQPSRWGSWGGLRHLDDANPRWDALMAANARAPTWEARDLAAFADGALRTGTDAAETLEGTPEEDDLLGMAGDDVLVAAGGSDRLHGGEGVDRAVLPGRAADWVRARDGAAWVLTAGRATVRLTAVEEVAFEAEPGTVLALTDGG